MKLQEFQAYLKKEQIDLAFLAHPDSHITYFTQMKPSFALLLVTPATSTLYLSKLDLRPRCPGITVKAIPQKWEEQLGSKKALRLGINKESLSVSLLEKLQSLFPSAVIVNIGKKITGLRSLKTAKEAANIQQACAITTRAFLALWQELPKKTLRTEKDVAFFLEHHIRSQGGEIAFPSIVATGKNSAVPHHVTSDAPLQQGFLQIDFGASFRHYCADMSRVFYLGRPTSAEFAAYHLLLRVQEMAIQEVRVNKPFLDLDKATRKRLGKSAPFFIHSLGHGVGIDIHEAPVYTTATIQKKQVFTIEPGLYFPKKYGLRIEDTLFFDGNIQLLTTAPKDLKIIP